jgi:hypothetical protein
MIAKRTTRSNRNLQAAQRLNEATADPTEGVCVDDDIDPAAVPAGGGIDRQNQIAELAYRLAERRGFVEGHELEDWLQAEQELGD